MDLAKPVTAHLDELDLKILRLLVEDARRSSKDIAEKLGVATGTVYNRIKRLTEEGVIKGYIPIIDASKLGFELTALVLIQADGKFLVDVENEISKVEGVVCVYDITGDFDAAIIARFKDRASMNKFIKSLIAIPHIKRTVTNVVLNIVKEDPRVRI